MRYLTQNIAQDIDVKLMSAGGGFSLDQLMELAGLSVAAAINDVYKPDIFKRPLICCGPGNNGGDGLVAARHLHHFGYNPTVLYPKPSSKDIYNRLIIQCKNVGIHFLDNLSSSDLQTHKHYDFLVDGIFGFGFKGDIRPPFDHILKVMKSTTLPIVSIDVPSGWDVENGDVTGNSIKPEMLVSLTAPKLCAKGFQGKYHYLGGRFVPPGIAKEYELEIPKYEAHCQFVKLN